jgi:hypothetical protein
VEEAAPEAKGLFGAKHTVRVVFLPLKWTILKAWT